MLPLVTTLVADAFAVKVALRYARKRRPAPLAWAIGLLLFAVAAFMGFLARILAGIGSGLGSLVLIGGALWSAWAFFRRRDQGRRALANAIIAVGVIIAATGGTVAFTGASGVLELTNLVGVSVMFVGFLLA